MNNLALLRERFDEVWILDTEFQAPSGEPHTPVCMCAVEMFRGREERLFFNKPKRNPLPIGPRILYVGWTLSAEWATWIQLGWALPENAIDLRFEFLNLINGVERDGTLISKTGTSLLAALQLYGLPCMSFEGKDAERKYIIANGVVPPPGVSLKEHRERILDYCDLDVIGTGRLFNHLIDHIDIDQSLFYGKYSFAVGWMENNGLSLDLPMLKKVAACAPDLKLKIVEEVEQANGYGVYEIVTHKKTGKRTQHWRQKNFAALVERLGITNWPRTGTDGTGGYSLDDKKVFRDMAKTYPYLAELRQAKKSVRDLSKFTVSVGQDGRNRFAVMPFGSLTGRNQPKARQFLMLKAKWFRHLMKPGPGMAQIQLDISAAETGLAAAFSDDPAGLTMYNSGEDPHLALAIANHAAPPGATKDDPQYADVRDLYKTAGHGINYGMMAPSLALRLNIHEYEADQIIAKHKRMYATYWAWADAQVKTAMRVGHISTAFGWTYHIQPGKGERTILNFPQQAGCGELLRLACCLMVDHGLGPYMCCPLHDAVYLECPIEIAESVADTAEECFREAGNVITDSRITVRVDLKIVNYPDRYTVDKGKKIWDIVQAFIAEREAAGYEFPDVDLCPPDIDDDEMDEAQEAA